jgi:hypothetical protein
MDHNFYLRSKKRSQKNIVNRFFTARFKAAKKRNITPIKLELETKLYNTNIIFVQIAECFFKKYADFTIFNINEICPLFPLNLNDFYDKVLVEIGTKKSFLTDSILKECSDIIYNEKSQIEQLLSRNVHNKVILFFVNSTKF